MNKCKHENAYPIQDGQDDYIYYCPDCGETGD
jgi:hypothetical protein